jgi:hypothetical protein
MYSEGMSSSVLSSTTGSTNEPSKPSKPLMVRLASDEEKRKYMENNGSDLDKQYLNTIVAKREQDMNNTDHLDDQQGEYKRLKPENLPYQNDWPVGYYDGYADVELEKRKTCDSNTDLDSYMRDYILMGRESCDVNKVNDKDFKQQFFGFRDNIWFDSHGPDAVDAINELYVAGNTDIARGYEGKRIKDVFDEIVGGYHGSAQGCTNTVPLPDTSMEAGYPRRVYNKEIKCGNYATNVVGSADDLSNEYPMPF